MLRRERVWKKFVELPRTLFAFEVLSGDRSLFAGEFADDLAAEAARWPCGRRVGNDHDVFDANRFWAVFGNGFPDGDALGADGAAVRRVFDVAAVINAAVF